MESLLASIAAWYYAYTEERARALCFLQDHVIVPKPRVKTYPTVEFQSLGSSTQFESMRPTNSGFDPILY